MSGGGQNTVVQNSQPPAAFLQAYQAANARAQGLGAQPYHPYPGQEVAPLSPAQNQGIGTIGQAYNSSQPFLSQAQNYIGASTAPLLPTIQPDLNQAQGGFNQAQSALQAGLIQGAFRPYGNQAQGEYNDLVGALTGNTIQNAFNPYGNIAQGEYGSLAGALSGNTLQNTMSPYVSNAGNAYTQTEGALGNNALTGIMSPYTNSASTGYGQAQGIVNSNALQNAFNPYAAQAGNTFGYGGQGITYNPVSDANIRKYESPYTQDVVNATQAEFNNQNAQQQQAVKGNAISNGAFGGDRSAVAAGITAGQEELAQAPVIAGLYNQGYSQALGEANTQQQTQLQQQIARTQAGLTGAQGIAGLGQEQVNALAQQYGIGLAGAQGQQSIGSQLAGALGQEYGLNLAAGQSQAALGQQEENALAQEYGFTGQAAQGTAAIGAEKAGLLGQEYGLVGQAAQGTAAIGAENAGLVGQEYGLGLQGAQGNLGIAQAALGANEANAWLNSQAGYGMANLGNENFGQLLQQGNADIGAGALQQQIAQEGLNVGLQNWNAAQAWPYQTTGWQAGIAEGLGGASGGTSSTTSPGPSIGSQIAGAGLTGAGILGMTNAFGAYGGGGWLPGLFGAGAGAASDFIPEVATTGAASAFPVIAGGLLAPVGGKRGGGIEAVTENRAPSGGITAFPGHLTRMPGTGPRGITANDNLAGLHHTFVPRLKFAGGGGAPDDDTGDFSIPSVPDQGMGISGPPAPPAAYGSSGITASPDQGQQQLPALPTHSPWEGLLAAGLNIMGGTSPHALTNIGRGVMQGLQYNEQQRAVLENEALKRLQLADTEKYQGQELGLRGQEIASHEKLAQAQMDQARAQHEAQLAQQLQLEKMRLGMEGANLAERRRFDDAQIARQQAELTPQSIRELEAYNKLTPEQQGQFRQMKMAEKGMTDIFGNPNSGSAVQPGSEALHGEDYLKTLNPQAAAMVKATAEGRMAFPLRPTPQQYQIIQATSQYDPTFDATDFNKRSSTAKGFASGQEAKAVTAINTATTHLSSLADQMDALHNGNIPAFNSISNWIKTQTGQSAPTTATETRDAVANELRKVFATTGGGGLEELKEWQSQFPINGSPSQQRDAIRQAVELMTPRLDSLAHQQSVGMGTDHRGLDLLSDEAKASWQKITGAVSPVARAPAPTYSPAGGGSSSIPRLTDPSEAAKLPRGSQFYDPNGILRIVP